MANYTVVLNDLLNTDFKLMLNDYPIFDEAYRQILNEKIINHYRFYEIGFMSPDRFNFELWNTMNEIMDFYNRMYEKVNNENFDIFNQNNLIETYEKEGTQKSTLDSKGKNLSDTNSTSNTKDSTKSNSQGNSSNDSKKSSSNTNIINGRTINQNKDGDVSTVNIKNDTPQGAIRRNSLDNGNYMTSYDESKQVRNKDESISQNDSKQTDNYSENVNSNSKDTNTNNVDSTSNTSSDSTNTLTTSLNNESDMKDTVTYIRKITGYQGIDNVELLNKYSNSLLNVDMLIINRLRDLFLIIY